MELQRMHPAQRTRRHISHKNSSCKQAVHHPTSVRKPAQLPILPCGDKKNLFVTGISITKLGSSALTDSSSNGLLGVEYAPSSQVTSAQTSGWRLKYIPVQNTPAIHAYSRSLKVNLNGHPLNSSNAQAKEFFQYCGRMLPPAVSQSWYNYQFASYTTLSRYPPPLEDPLYRTDRHGSTGVHPFHCVQRKDISSTYKQLSNKSKNMKPRFTDAATQTKAQIYYTQENENSNLINEKPDVLDLRDVSTHFQPENEQLGRKHPNSLNESRNLLVPDPQLNSELSHFLRSSERETNSSRSLSPPPIVVMSPEPWTSQTPPDKIQLSIVVPTLPRPSLSQQ
ncbi:uncharacterized protein ACMZJ9_004958 [Mantella aurantiaca]